eukprot:scaffold5198_cov173-Amphora_coffeaeformis.AAC.6
MATRLVCLVAQVSALDKQIHKRRCRTNEKANGGRHDARQGITRRKHGNIKEGSKSSGRPIGFGSFGQHGFQNLLVGQKDRRTIGIQNSTSIRAETSLAEGQLLSCGMHQYHSIGLGVKGRRTETCQIKAFPGFLDNSRIGCRCFGCVGRSLVEALERLASVTILNGFPGRCDVGDLKRSASFLWMRLRQLRMKRGRPNIRENDWIRTGTLFYADAPITGATSRKKDRLVDNRDEVALIYTT